MVVYNGIKGCEQERPVVREQVIYLLRVEQANRNGLMGMG